MSTIRVRDYTGRVHEFTAEQLVTSAMYNASGEGQLESLRTQLAALSYMVARLVEKTPPSEWLEIVGAYHLDEVSEEE